VALGAIATGSKDAMKVLVDATKKAVADQRNELKSLGREIDGLTSAYERLNEEAEKLKAAGKGGETLGLAAGGLQQQLLERMGKAGEIHGNVQVMEDRLRQLTKPQGPPTAAAQPGQQPAGPGMMYQGAMLGQAISGALAKTLSAGAAAVQTYKGAADVNTAQTMVTGNRILGELARGDLRGLAELRTDAGRRIYDRYGGTGGATASAVADAAGGAAGMLGQAALLFSTGGAGAAATAGKGLAAARGVGAAGNMAAGGTGFLSGIYNKFFAGGISGEEAANVEAGLMVNRQLAPGQQMAWDMMQQYAGIRVHGAKALQGRHFSALGIGAGYGLDFGQSVGQAESLLGATGDVGQVFGSGGRSYQRAKKGTGGYAGYDPVQMQAFGQAIGTGSAAGVIDAKKAKEMFDTAFPAKAPEMETIKTKGSRGYMQLANEFMRMGVSQEAAMGTLTGLGAGAQALGTSRMQAPEAANKQLEEVFARGIKKGFDKDVTSKFSEALGKTMAESAFGVGGATGGYSERLQALMAGLGPDSTMRDVQNAAQAQGAINQLTQSNPYINMVQTAAGIKAIGPGGSGLAARALQMSSMQELMGGNKFLEAAGVTEEQRMATMRDTAGGILGTFAGGGKNMTLDQRAAAITANTGVSFDVARQMVGMLELEQKGVFEKPITLDPKDKKKFRHGDLAESVFATQAQTIVAAMGFEKDELAPLIKSMQKEGDVKKGLDEFMKTREGATGEFTQGNQYVVQVMSGPIKKGQAPGSVGATK